MCRASIVIYGLVFFVFHSVIAFEFEASWHYPDRSETNEFPEWGGICDSGYHQSPIDLSVNRAVKGDLPYLQFDGYDENLINPLIANTGHSIQLANFDSIMTLSGGPLPGDYVVEQFHFHWWSEHTINKVRYPLELHIVHRNTLYESITEAAVHKDGLVVVGVLFHNSNEANKGIQKIIDTLHFINFADAIDNPIGFEDELNLRELFPDLSSGYLTYPGSLTTPSCQESVIWIVLMDTFPVTMEQVDEFRNVETYGGEKIINNYRDEQELNDREVLIVRKTTVPEERNIRKSSGLEIFAIPQLVLLASVLALVLSCT